MKTKPICSLLVLTLVVTGFVTGCETTGQSTGLGAVLGAGVGYAIGGEKGALIGAAVGGVAGFAIHKAREKRIRTAQETAAEYKYEPSQGLRVDLRPATTASPTSAPQGTTMNAQMEYAVMGSGTSGAAIKEKQVIKKGDEEFAQLRDESVNREDGTWNVVTPIEVSTDVDPGQYVLEQTLTVANNNYSTRTPFTVTAKTAKSERQVTFGPTEFVVASR